MRFRLFALGAILFTGLAQPQDPADKVAFETVCGKCHATSMIDSFRSEPDWRDTVVQMVEYFGAQGTSEQLAGVMRYLRRVWTKINVNTATADEIAATLGVSDAVAKSMVAYRSRTRQILKPATI